MIIRPQGGVAYFDGFDDRPSIWAAEFVDAKDIINKLTAKTYLIWNDQSRIQKALREGSDRQGNGSARLTAANPKGEWTHIFARAEALDITGAILARALAAESYEN